jgi:hypothetical protein
MTILGFSHIVSETNDINSSVLNLKNLNFEIEYKISQEVQKEKYLILDKNPKHVDLVYLRNKNYPFIGVELIKHSFSSSELNNKLILAYTGCAKDELINLDGNKIIFIRNDKSNIKQHIIIPVSNLERSKNHYVSNFGLKKSDLDFDFLYKETDLKYKRTTALFFPNTIYDSWKAILHLLEIKKDYSKVNLNNIGFSCFCFIVKKNGMENISRKNEIIGPLSGYKIIKGIKKNFSYAFIRDPDGYFNEFYII